MKDADFAERYIIGVGLDPIGNTPEEFAEFLRADRERVERKVKISGAKFD